MSKIKLISCSDDRSGRKGGQYRHTQDRMSVMLNGWINQHHYRLPEFIDCDPLMANIDPAKNGRVYKPWCIQQALATMADGDYLIYNDCSPELWNVPIDLTDFDLSVIQSLTDRAGGILVGFVKWDDKPIGEGEFGRHTHRYFSPNNLFTEFKYIDSYLCASGMICIKKSIETQSIIDDWLAMNRQPEYSCINVSETEDNYFTDKPGSNLGHRHDQSILSILLNRLDWPYCSILYNDMNPYNFLNYCRKGAEYTFINSNNPHTPCKL